VRRALPWALCGVVGVAAGAAAWLGAATASSASPAGGGAAFVAQVVTVTQAAGTAHFTYSYASRSSNPVLASSTAGRGAVNFAERSLTTDGTDHQTNLRSSGLLPATAVSQTSTVGDIWIGRTNYLQMAGGPGGAGSWTSFTFPPDTFGALGPLATVDPIDELLQASSVEDLKVVDAGRADVGGTETTRYRLTGPACTSKNAAGALTVGLLEIWVDDQDRLVQARESETETISAARLGAVAARFPTAPSLASLAGRLVLASSVHLFDFGAPVTISPPPTVPMPVGASSSGGAIATARAMSDCLL